MWECDGKWCDPSGGVSELSRKGADVGVEATEQGPGILWAAEGHLLEEVEGCCGGSRRCSEEAVEATDLDSSVGVVRGVVFG